jgi:hypothetical protein
MNLNIRSWVPKLGDSVVFVLLFTVVLLGWLVAIKAHEKPASDDQYEQQSSNGSGTEDWLSSMSR